MKLRFASLLSLLAVLSFACSTSTSTDGTEPGAEGGGDDGGENDGGGDAGNGGDEEAMPETFMFYRASAHAVDPRTGDDYVVASQIDAYAYVARLFFPESGGPPLPFFPEFVHAEDGMLKATDAKVQRENDGSSREPETREIADVGLPVFQLRAEYDVDRLWALADTAAGWKTVVADEDRTLMFMTTFPAQRPMSPLYEGRELVGWLAVSHSGDVIRVNKDFTTTPVLEVDNVQSLGETPSGVPLFIADGNVYAYDDFTGAVSVLFEGGGVVLDTLLMDYWGEGLVLGLTVEQQFTASLQLFFLSLGQLATHPFATLTGLELGSDSSLVAAGGRVVVSARFEDAAERRMESVSLEGDVETLRAGSDVPAFLTNRTHSAPDSPWMFLNTGSRFFLPQAHALRVDGSDSKTFDDAQWIAPYLTPTLAEIDGMLLEEHLPGEERGLVAVRGDDPTHEKRLGSLPDGPFGTEIQIGSGLAALASVFLDDTPNRDVFMVELPTADDPEAGAVHRLTETPDKDEGLLFLITPTLF